MHDFGDKVSFFRSVADPITAAAIGKIDLRGLT
jgi:hypothetical protein